MPQWRSKILHAATKRLGAATNDKNKNTPNWTVPEKNKIKRDQPETLSCGALQQRDCPSICESGWGRLDRELELLGPWAGHPRVSNPDPYFCFSTGLAKWPQPLKKKGRLLSGIICKQGWEFTGQMLTFTESEGWDLVKKEAQLINFSVFASQRPHNTEFNYFS